MKKVSGSLKLIYSQYRELQGFAQFGSDLDNDTKARLAQGERIVEVLKQDRNTPVEVELQVVIIYAAVNGFLKDIEVENISKLQDGLFDYMKNSHDDILKTIRETGDLSKETADSLAAAIDEYKSTIM